LKKGLKILLIIVAVLLLLCAGVFIALNNKSVQMKIVGYAERELSEKLGTEVRIGGAYYKFFSNISLNDVYIQSLENDTLAFIGNAQMRFSFLKLFKNQFVVRSLALDNLYANLKVDSTGTNFDFIINAFRKPKTDTKSSNFVLNINKIEIKNSAFDYKNLKNNNFKQDDKIFNANNLKISDINTEISFDFWRTDSIFAQIKNFSAKEHSGMIINDLTAKAVLGKNNIKVDFLKIKLPNSNINFGKTELRYDSITDFQDFNTKILLTIPLEKSEIALNDLYCFVPYFQNINERFNISGNISGTVSNLSLQNFTLGYGKNTNFIANIEANGLPNIAEMFIYSDIEQFSSSIGDIQDLIANFNRQPVGLPATLGKITYKGNVSGFLSNLVVFGNLQTAVGNAQTDILLKFSNHLQDLKYSGRIQSNNLQLGEIINNQQVGNIAFDISTTGVKLPNSGFSGKIDGKIIEFDYNKYIYKNLQLAGNYDKRGFEGKATIEDENVRANFEGRIDLTDNNMPIFNFLLNVKDANLHNLHLYEKFSNSILTFNASTNVSGNSLDNLNGFVHLDSITFINNDKILNINEITVTTSTNDGFKNIVLSSDFASGNLNGNFSYNTITQTFNNILNQYLPALVPSDNKNQKPTQNQIQMNLTLSNLNKITDIFGLPFSLEGDGTLNGEIDEISNNISLNAEIPDIYFKKQHIENIHFTINNNENDVLKLNSVAGVENSKKQIVNIILNAYAANDLINSDLKWNKNSVDSVSNTNHIFFSTQLSKSDVSLVANANIKSAQVSIADSLWNINASSIVWTADKKLKINNFRMQNDKQFLSINGVASASAADKIKIEINNLSLGLLLSIVKFDAIAFDGVPTGEIEISSVLSKPVFVANLSVGNATMNKMSIGNAKLFSTFDQTNNSIVIDGTFLNQNTDTLIIARGNYFLKNDSLDLSFNSHGIGISFLNPFFQNVVRDVDGQGFGKLRLFGKPKSFCFDGDVFVKNGTANVSLLNTTYTFNDTVHLRPKSLYVNNLSLYDNENNQAFASGEMTHSGMFQHPIFDFTIQAKNMLALDTHSNDNEYFFGKVFADGTVQIKGNERVANFNINAVSKPHSKLYIRMQNTNTATDNGFIRFVNNNKIIDNQIVKETAQFDSKMLSRVNMQVEVTPDVEVELIVDPKSGDLINASGNGDLRLEFDSRSDDMRLFGTYTISNGYYLFSMQNVIRKDFKINSGSAITWSGNMRNANVSISAIYSLSASLRDLVDEKEGENMRTNVPVNCVLQLTDNLMRPTIALDLELPQSDATSQQIVKNVVNTQEMMNREIVSLLLMGRFYKPEYLNTTNQANTGNEAFSFAAATLNGLISKLLQSREFSVGLSTNYTEQGQEYKAAINIQPNDRLTINGNVGYQNDVLSNNGTRYITDFDVDYKFTENGKLLFKVYNHTVDRLGSPKQSQGIGVAYREDFSSVSDMISFYWKKLTGIFRSGEKEL